MKLLYMIDDLRFGGAQRQIVELIKNIDRSWIEPSLAVYHPSREYAPELDAMGIRIVYIPKRFKYSPWYLARLTAYIRRTNPGIIHSFMQTPNFWARVGGVLGRCHVIITSIRNSRFPQRNLERFLSRVSSRIIVNSTVTRTNLLRLGVSSEKIVVIYNGVDTRRFAPGVKAEKAEARRYYDLPLDRNIFTLVGKFEKQKNHHCLIRALCAMQRKGVALPLTVFVGENYDPALKKRLKIHVASAGLGEHIRFLKPTTCIQRIYALSDVIVLPSLWEGCANVLLESFSCGIPVVCSDIPENADIVKDGENGFLFRSDDSEALVACLMNVIKMDNDYLERVGAMARRRAEQDFSLQQMASKTMTVYAEAFSWCGH